MATVYAARDIRHGRKVALKVLRSDLAATLGAERFRREITLAAGLQHPHIVPVHDSGETPSGTLWFTMPLIEGESLRDRLRRERQLSIDEALRITREVALALDYAHRHGVIHRDIKPENILLVDGQAIVADFGIARPTTAAGSGETLTATGMSIGTPAYMSPEQAAGERTLDARTDVYSLGAVCYEMLTGEPPFAGPTAQAIAAKMMSGDVPSIRRVRPSVPETVEEAVRRALAPIPADRYATAGDFARALETAERTALISGSGTSAKRVRRRFPVAAAVLVGLVAIGGALLLAWRTRHATGSAPNGPVRIAVLPFDNLGDSADTYFADGITDEVRGKLAALPGLEVISTASSSQYRRTTKPQDEIGRELRVRYLLVGRVWWDKPPIGASRVRVEPELVQVADVRSPTNRWQAPFDAPLTDVFQVQTDIARQVASALEVRLTPAAQQVLAERPTQNLDAYVAYLRGEEASKMGDDRATVRRQIDAYRQAVNLDPTFALAWARLTLPYALLQGGEPTLATLDSARITAERAMTLAPHLPDALGAMSFYTYFVQHDYGRALSLDSTALVEAPNDPVLLYHLAGAEAFAGRFKAAVAHQERLTSLDPRFAQALWALGGTYTYLHRCLEARAPLDRALALEPSNLQFIQGRTHAALCLGDLADARSVLRAIPSTVDAAEIAAYYAANGGLDDKGWVLDSAEQLLLLTLRPSAFNNDRGAWAMALAEQYGFRGDEARARAYADSALPVLEDDAKQAPSEPHMMLGFALAYLGQKERAMRVGEHALALRPVAKDHVLGPWDQLLLAQIYVRVGEQEKALDLLESLLRIPSPITAAWLRIDPHFARLRGNPRFERLIAQQATNVPPTS